MSTRLPNELLEYILLQLPALHDSKESVRTLCRFGEANSRFRAISQLSNVWHSHYVAQWTRHNPEREATRKMNTRCHWWKMYIARILADSIALGLLDSVITSREQRDANATELASFGYDVWHAVQHQTTRVCYQAMRDKDTQSTVDVPTQGLTLQYWAREVLCVISRIRSVNILKKLSRHPDAVCFEQGLAAMSGFFGADLDKIEEELDRLAQSCREYLASQGFPKPPSQTELIIAICAWMRQEGFVKSDLVNFHNLLNHFPHSVLFGERRTLPISLVYVFVCIARRLGINAYPVAFPHRALAVVFPPVDQPGDAIYVNVFESATQPILSYFEDLPAILLNLGLDPATLPQHAAPARTALIIARVASNIILSLNRPMVWHRGDQSAAHYAAHCAALLVTGDRRLLPALFVNGVHGPLDCAVVFKGALAKCLPEAAQQELNALLDNVTLEEETYCRGDAHRGNVLYFTGMLFRHRKYGYAGLVKGWNHRCEAKKEWIGRMKINDLPRGVDQPFYHSLTTDGLAKYVAEENMEPLFHPTPSDIRTLLEKNLKTLGRWFDGFHIDSGRFILSHELRLLYPLDEAIGSEFIEAGRRMSQEDKAH